MDLPPPRKPTTPGRLPHAFVVLSLLCWLANYATDDVAASAMLAGAQYAFAVAQVVSIAWVWRHWSRERRQWLADMQAQTSWLEETARALQGLNGRAADAEFELLRESARSLTRYGNRN